jgi:hypothetical protein
MVVDNVHQHVFLDGGPGVSDIVVCDFNGNVVTTIPSEPGASGLLVSPDGSTVYAALTSGDAISAIDTTTLTERARYATGTGTLPTSIALAGGKLWFGHTTWLTASYGGDYRYAPAYVGRMIDDHAAVGESLQRWFSTSSYDGIHFRLYHRSIYPLMTVSVASDKAGQCVYFDGQRYCSGAWHSLGLSQCFPLTGSSTAQAYINLTSFPLGSHFRVLAEYVPSNGDESNLATTGAWQYFSIVG